MDTIQDNSPQCNIFSVIPLENNGKRPILDEWQKEEARASFDFNSHQGNLGYVVGKDYMVLDIDPRNSGDESFKKLQEDFPAFGFMYVPTVDTAGGGQHYYFRLPDLPEGFRIRKKLKQYPGIDWLHGNMYVVAPGSTNGAGAWRWREDAVMPPQTIDPSLMISLFPQTEEVEEVDRGDLWGVFTPEDLKNLLANKNPIDFCDQDDWFQLMSACHHATAGEGIHEFVEWSISDPEYSDHANLIEYRWNSLTADGSGKPITARSFGHMLGGVPDWVKTKLGFADPVEEFKPVKDTGRLEEKVKWYEDLIKSESSVTLSSTLWPQIAADSLLDSALRQMLGKKIANKMGVQLKTLEGQLPQLAEDKEDDEGQHHIQVAEAVLQKLGGYEKVVYHTESFWTFEKTHWKRAEEHNIRYLIQRLARKPTYNIMVTGAAISSIYSVLLTLLPKRQEDFFNPDDTTDIKINCLSGVLTLKNGKWELSEHSPKHRMNYVVPVKYEPGGKCPVYDKYIHRSVDGCEDTKRSLLTFLIYSMVSRKPWLRKAVLLYGPTSSGKTVFLDLLSNMVGKENASSLELESLTESHAMESLPGKLINISGEIDSGQKVTAKKFKGLVSGDLMHVNPKHKKGYNFRNTAVLWASGNHYPRIKDSSSATSNRVTIVSFPNTIDNSLWDHELDHKLNAEINAIFASALLVFAEEYEKDRCIKATLTQERSRKREEEWTKQQRPLTSWRDDRIEITEDKEDFVTFDQLYADYAIWARETNHKVTNKTRFGVLVAEMDLGKPHRTSKSRGYKFVKFKPVISDFEKL